MSTSLPNAKYNPLLNATYNGAGQIAGVAGSPVGVGQIVFPYHNTTIAPSASIAPMWISNQSILGTSASIPTPKRRETVWMKALYKLNDEGKFHSESKNFFKEVHSDVIIEHLGKFNPMYNRKPKRVVFHLLSMAAAPARVYNQLHYRRAGLCYELPAVPKRSRAKGRLTAAGVLLLDYWAAKYPKFKPFVDAFLPAKARGEIMSDCTLMVLGNGVPPCVQKRLDQIDAIKRRDQEFTKHVQEMERQRQRWLAQLAKNKENRLQQYQNWLVSTAGRRQGKTAALVKQMDDFMKAMKMDEGERAEAFKRLTENASWDDKFGDGKF